MGIRGLTTYIARHSDQYLEPFDLHDTYLVIDGNSLASQLYNWHARCNCAFGGDYDKYAQCVREFFDNLIKCGVIPLVLIDGGYENKKVKTVYARLRSKIQMASYFTPAQKLKFFPLLMKEVFRDVMNEKSIKYAQCAFEADDEIAAIARSLECPVLSYDSDFFIYGVLYIPFDTLDSGIVKCSKTNGYIKKCKIYRVENFLNSFDGLDRSLLPLVATLLGNDYIKSNVFKQFFQNLKLSKLTKKNDNEQQRRIAALLHWLKPYTLNGAIAAVLMRIQKEYRRRVLRKMEAVIDGYMNSYPQMLSSLGFSEEYVADIKSQRGDRIFKFQEDLDSLETVEESNITDYVMETKEDDEEVYDDGDDEDDDEDEDESINEFDEVDFHTDNFLNSVAPPWFIAEYSKGQFSSYFIDMMYRQLYFCPPQIEDYFYPTSHLASLKIIGVIYELLTSSRKDVNKNLEYVTRNKNKRGTRYQLESFREILTFHLPPLKNLNTFTIFARAEILTCTLGIPKDFNLNHIVPEWRLYLAIIIYWAQQEHEPLVTNCHVYSLLCSMLFGIIDQKIGFYRSTHKFDNKYNSKIKTILDKRKSVTRKAQELTNSDMMLAQKSVTVDDCLIAAPFFISNFSPDPKTLSNSKAFNVTTVHSFAQFQSCLRHSMHLNALLGYPYEQTKVAEVYNGTLLYNLYNNFRKRNDIKVYISTVLKESQSLLQIFNLLLNAIEVPLTKVFKNKVNQKRKRKNKNKVKQIEEEEEEDKYMSCVCEDEYFEKTRPFIDPNNPFCILNAME